MTTPSVSPLDPPAQGFVVAAFLQLDMQLLKPAFQYEGEVDETHFCESVHPLRDHEYIPVDLIQQVQRPLHVTGELAVRDDCRGYREDYVEAVNGDLGDGGYGYDGRGWPRGIYVEHDLGQTHQYQERHHHAVCRTRRHLSECLGFRTTGGKPPYLKICSRSDPKLNQCIMESVEILRPYLVTGTNCFSLLPEKLVTGTNCFYLLPE
uniref:Uncharacterized protein n=1 Tax=Timema monikensis TaxID=170555 RepID=A0A7R9HQ90_9NEOP|nr:unnamed protein product [Timema monikensis]